MEDSKHFNAYSAIVLFLILEGVAFNILWLVRVLRGY